MSLNVENITFGYSRRNVLTDVSLSVEEGTVLGLLGPNGTGKTTLLKCMNQVIKPHSGKVTVFNQDVQKMSPRERAQHIGYVPQYNNMMFPGTVADTVMMGRMPFVSLHLTKRDRDIVFGVLQLMQLEQFALKNVGQLSGGERQRVFVARALAQEPKVLLLDEPTSSLDLKNQLLTLQLVRSLAKEKRLTVVLTIHDLNLAAMFCDQILMLRDSRVFACGSCRDVLTVEHIAQVYDVNTEVTEPDGIVHTRLLDVKNG